MKTILLILLILASFASNAKEYTIVLGNLWEQEYVPDVVPSGCLKENVICTSFYFKYKIEVKDVLIGEDVGGVVQAARLQHATMLHKGRELAVFVLSRIENPKTRELLGTDFFLEEHEVPIKQYCFSKSLKTYLSDLDITGPSIGGCVRVSSLYWEIKQSALETLSSRLEEKLKQEKLLFGYSTGYSYDGNVYDNNSISEEEVNCSIYGNLNQYVDAEKCYSDQEPYEVVEFTVKKGYADSVKMRILNELRDLRLGMDNIEMNFQVYEKRNVSILQLVLSSK